MTRVTFEESVKALSKPPKNKVEPKHEQLIEEVKARRAKKDKPNVAVRQNILESTNRTNYMMEYDRLKGIMKSGTIGAQQSQRIAKIQQELKELVRLSVGGTLPPKQRSKHSTLSQTHAMF